MSDEQQRPTSPSHGTMRPQFDAVGAPLHVSAKMACSGSKRSVRMADDGSTMKVYKRDPAHRIFVSRSLRLEKIRFFGFDMDYTLAIYKSPDYESLVFDRVVERLISIGYPEDLRKFHYHPNFPVRGLWFDHLYGNLLKVDGFGNILVGVHGFHFMKPSEIEELYPNKFLYLTESRVFVLNTLFNLPETYLLACLVNYFDKSPDYKKTDDGTGVSCGDVGMSYKSIFQDCRSAVDWIHLDSDLKKFVVDNVEQYVVKDERTQQLLTQLRNNGAQTFLLTNSEYFYTNGLMTYLLGQDWMSYFNIAVVDARKPLWFAEGTVFRQVNTQTGALKIGTHTGPLQQGQVYSGGSCDAFRRLVKARGKDVLYIGDHIFGDVLRSKKTRGWRTFLVVPELTHELSVWTNRRPLFEQLTALDTKMAEIYRNLDSSAKEKPAVNGIVQSIRDLTHEMDQEYSMLGSLFRSGSRTTFFASQVERYADLYASSCCNLTYYPLFYFFRAPMMLMPHEATVDHSSRMQEMHPDIATAVPTLNHLALQINEQEHRAATPESTTFCHEESEEEAAATNSNSSDVDTSSAEHRRRDLSLCEDPRVSSTDVLEMQPEFVEH